MEYIRAVEENLEQIYDLVQKTITTIYPKYYPRGVVDFFCKLHSKENIKNDIEYHHVRVLRKEDIIIGTGSYIDNHITRVFVASNYQHHGYGSIIMKNLEKEISYISNKAVLDASLPAAHFYEKRGYQTMKHKQWECENNSILVYEIMEKELNLHLRK